MKPFTESMRYEYPLKPTDLVVDVGGYEGRFANTIADKYGCRVWCFEPVFYDELKSKLRHSILIFEKGLAGSNRTELMHIKGDSTGVFADGEPRQVELVDIVEAIQEPVALLKLNCEGCEFEILEALLERGNPFLYDNIQVQFHPVVPGFQARWESIRERLLQTHELTYDAPWCWENYKLK
jgi:FkbM family methyltransferase